MELVATYPKVDYTVKCPLIEDARVAEHRAVFNKDWTINLDGSHHFLIWDCKWNAWKHVKDELSFQQRCDQLTREAMSKGVVELPDDAPYVLCTHYWKGTPFGHWFETLASLRMVPIDDYKVLVHTTGGPVSTHDIDIHLDIIGVPPERQVFFKWWGPTPVCKRLYCPSIDSQVGHISKDSAAWLKMKYLGNPKVMKILDGVPRKLYLSRNFFTHPNPDWTRLVLNEEAEVWPYLESRGFTLLKGDEPLYHLINCFHSATHIVFPHGSMFFYSLFSVLKPKVVEFISEHRVRDDNRWHVVETGITPDENYKMIVTPANPKTNDMVINMDELRREIP